MPASSVLPAQVSNVTCPFCGLGCDDLVIGTAGKQLAVLANGCGVAKAGFERDRVVNDTGARIGGRSASLAEATKEAARRLAAARQPVIGGLATDVAGARAATRLGERIGAVLDHMNYAAALRNVLVLQDGGWVTTTLSEVRNRADLLIVAGGDPAGRFPRLFERCIDNRETLFATDRRPEVVFLGTGPAKEVGYAGEFRTISCEASRLHEGFAVLRALLAGRTLQAGSAAGVALSEWKTLADRMRAAHYGVIAWAAADFNFPHAELTVQSLCELVKDLNRETRFSGLPLGGTDGDVTYDAVQLWQTGFGSRTSLARGTPEHDPYYFSLAGMLERGETDALLWINGFSPGRTPPSAEVPTVVLGPTQMRLEREPEVFITVGTPGVDHSGHMFRTDRVVALPLRQLRESGLPSVAEAIAAIEAAL